MSDHLELQPTGPLVQWQIGERWYTGRVMELPNGMLVTRHGPITIASLDLVLIQQSCGGPVTFVPWSLCKPYPSQPIESP